jgi:tRNA (guanine9-N1)-methyltransferase
MDNDSSVLTMKDTEQEAAHEVTAEAPAPLSKKAQKKALKLERIAEKKVERRARDKELKKEKQRIKAEKRAAGELLEEDERAKKRPKTVFSYFDARIVLDLGFDDKMLDKVVPFVFV